MKLTIVIDQPTQASLSNASIPSLQHLLGIGTQGRVEDVADALLCQAASIEKQVDWPIAAISALAEFDISKESPDYWLNVDLVHFVLQRDYFTLAEILPLDTGEMADFMLSLNRHFAEDGLEFIQGASGQCYLRLQSDPEISTTQPQQAIGLETTSYMPRGAGAAKWNRLLNEMQMLLFEHPINQARELVGQLAANSIWLSGGGVLPHLANSQPSERVLMLGETPLIKGLNLINEQSALYVLPNDMPPNAQALLSNAADSIWLRMESKHVASVESAETIWFEPLLQALKQRKLTQLTLLFEQHGHMTSLQLRPRDTWKFWRKSLPLAELLPQPHLY